MSAATRLTTLFFCTRQYCSLQLLHLGLLFLLVERLSVALFGSQRGKQGTSQFDMPYRTPPRNFGEVAQGRVPCSLGLVHYTWSCVCRICLGLYENTQTGPQPQHTSWQTQGQVLGIFKGTRIEWRLYVSHYICGITGRS